MRDRPAWWPGRRSDRAETPGPLLRGGCAWAGVPGLPAWQGRHAAGSLPVSEPQRALLRPLCCRFPPRGAATAGAPTRGGSRWRFATACGERRAGFAAMPHPTKGRSLCLEGAAERRRGMVRRWAERRPPGRRKAQGIPAAVGGAVREHQTERERGSAHRALPLVAFKSRPVDGRSGLELSPPHLAKSHLSDTCSTVGVITGVSPLYPGEVVSCVLVSFPVWVKGVHHGKGFPDACRSSVLPLAFPVLFAFGILCSQALRFCCLSFQIVHYIPICCAFHFFHHYILCFFRAFFSSLATLALSDTVAAIQASPSKGQARHGSSSPCCLAGQSAQTLRSCCKAVSQSTCSSCCRTCFATGGGISVHGLFTVSLPFFHQGKFFFFHVFHYCRDH